LIGFPNVTQGNQLWPNYTVRRIKRIIKMPEISRFYGIIVAMFFDDHNPPHFHARYGGEKMEDKKIKTKTIENCSEKLT
jgi:hypothetical protein